jgi:hypothetical protein
VRPKKEPYGSRDAYELDMVYEGAAKEGSVKGNEEGLR